MKMKGKRKDQIKRCKCPCNRELPPRYKGRERTFYDSHECRKIWGDMTKKQQNARLKEIKKQENREELLRQKIREKKIKKQ